MDPEGPGAAPEEPAFDVEAYASSYAPHAKVERLLFIAQASADPSIQLEALKLALDEAKQAGSAIQYTAVMERANGRLTPDSNWLEETERRIAVRAEKLEADLNGYKQGLVKESIRMGHSDLGDFFYQIGDLQNAFKSYMRMRDYCATSKQIISMCMHVIKVGCELGNYVHVNNYIQKAEQTPDIAKDTLAVAQLKCASALSFLKSKKYNQAALKFSEVSADLGTHYTEVIAPQDVAMYGALCSLASFSRPQMKSRIIDNVQFREFLELVPEMREALHDFYASRYSGCLAYLERLRPSLALDMHAAPHVDSLYASIRSRALIQYTQPFTSLDLKAMAAAFTTTVGELQKELEALIVSDRVAARIDSHKSVLYARHADQQRTTFQYALKTGEEYMRTTKALLLRANLQKHDFMQRSLAPRQPRGVRAE